MAATVTAGVSASINAKRRPDSGFYEGKDDDASLILSATLRESGTTADKCDLRYVKRLTFTAGIAQTIDLASATGDDGVVNAFAKVVAMAIRVRSTTPMARLTIDNAGATNPFIGFLNSAGTLYVYPSTLDADGASLKNNGFLLLVAPNDPAAPVDATHKNLRLLPSSHNFTADVVILGRSA